MPLVKCIRIELQQCLQLAFFTAAFDQKKKKYYDLNSESIIIQLKISIKNFSCQETVRYRLISTITDLVMK